MASEESFVAFEAALQARALSSPWEGPPQSRTYAPDYELLAELLSIPLRDGHGQASGRFAKAIDAWTAHELRRAGFGDDEVWPRLTRPRVLPREVSELLRRLPRTLSDQVRVHVERLKEVAPSEAKVLGRVFVKQADVLIADWSRGPELLVSTKSMLSSFGKNLRNRFEESYGDAKNLRGRFPLLSLGFLYLLRGSIRAEPASWELAVDMLRKLREETDVYDATALVVVDWTEGDFQGVTIDNEVVPADLRLGQFLGALVENILLRTPIQFHVRVRELRESRALPVVEGDQPGELEDDG